MVAPLKRWLGVRLESMGNTMNLAAAIIIIWTDYTDWFAVGAGIAGLVLTYTQQVYDERGRGEFWFWVQYSLQEICNGVFRDARRF